MSHKKPRAFEFYVVGVIAMALLTLLKKNKESGLFPLDRLKKAKKGNQRERDALLLEYKPFILRVTSDATGHFVTPNDSDEFSIALMAFNEAIDSFDESKGHNFLKFSEQLIKWRLTDYQRKQRKQRDREISFETEYTNGEAAMDKNPELAVEEKAFDQIDLKSQIRELQKTLSCFGISFSKLASSAPKHLDSRMLMVDAARKLSREAELMGFLNEKKELPVSALVKLTGLNRKTFYRNRDYVIALAIIFSSDMEDIRNHIENMAREVTK